MKLLNAIQAQVEGQPHGCMYVEIIINENPLQAMLDTQANTVYKAKDLLMRLAFPTPMEKALSRELILKVSQLRVLLGCPHPNRLVER